MQVRIGNGYDVHRFGKPGEGEAIVLGGVSIPHTRRLLAHSDGDVLIHALCDALLGSLALGDIGQHFPDTNPAYQNVDSTELLEKVYVLIRNQNYLLLNTDITVVAQAPKIAPYITQMRSNIARLLSTEDNCVSIKATTTEGLGFIGREEGIAVYAVVLLKYLQSNG